LASSTLVPGNSGNDALGFVVSYSLRVKLNLGTLGGELQADLPFKLVHPGPGNYNKSHFCGLVTFLFSLSALTSYFTTLSQLSLTLMRE
jgi:hypothetical protein